MTHAKAFGAEFCTCAKMPHHAVAVVDADDKLLKVPASVRLRQPLRPAHQAEQVAARRILHCDRQVVRRQEHLRMHCYCWFRLSFVILSYLSDYHIVIALLCHMLRARGPLLEPGGFVRASMQTFLCWGAHVRCDISMTSAGCMPSAAAQCRWLAGQHDSNCAPPASPQCGDESAACGSGSPAAHTL